MDSSARLMPCMFNLSQQPYPRSHRSLLNRAVFNVLYQWFDQDVARISIFGSTMSRDKIDPARELPKFELNAVLQRAQSWSWVGCPAELIGVLHALNGLQSQAREPSPEDVESALASLENFSCSDWAINFPGKDLHQQRLDMASAYKGAIMIYASRTLGTHYKNTVSVADMVVQTLHHLKQISPSDSHFKGILWPAFIVGAEARLPEQQLWIANALEQLYGMVHMWNIKRGLSVLQRLWERPLSSQDSTPWLEEVYDMDEKLMLI